MQVQNKPMVESAPSEENITPPNPHRNKPPRLIPLIGVALAVILLVAVVLVVTSGSKGQKIVGNITPTVAQSPIGASGTGTALATVTAPNNLLQDALLGWDTSFSHTANLAFDITNPVLFDGDSSRVKRITPTSEEVVWKQDGMKYFEAVVYFWPGEDVVPMEMFISVDGTNWLGAIPTVQGGEGDWKRFTYTLTDLTKANYVRMRWANNNGAPWSPQIGKVAYSNGLPASTTTVAPNATTAAVAANPVTTAASPAGTASVAATATPAQPNLLTVSRTNLTGHSGPINAVSWTKDGRYYATASDDKTIKVWDAALNKVVLTLDDKKRPHTAPIVSVAWSSKGNYLVSASADKFINYYSVFSSNGGSSTPPGTVLLQASDGVAPTTALLSPDDNLLPYPGVGVLNTWDFKNDDLGPKFVLNNYSADITSLAFSPDNKYLAIGLSDDTVQIWDVPAVKLLQKLETTVDKPNSATALTWTPDSRQLVIGRQKSFDVILIKPANGATTVSNLLLRSVTAPVSSLGISSDGKRLAVGTQNGEVQLWSLENYKSSQQFNGEVTPVIGLHWNSDNSQITVANGGTLPMLTNYTVLIS